MTHARMDALRLEPCSEFGWDQKHIRECLFARARKRAQRGQFWSMLIHRPRDLLALKQVTDVCTVETTVDGGSCLVPIRQIRGSEGRSMYFDSDFNPRYDRERGRWLNIARARQRGRDLPPVALVRVGDVYFVQDGHHRISVARALGQLEIEARVILWQVCCPLTWELVAPDPGSGRGRLHERATTALGAILMAVQAAGRDA